MCESSQYDIEATKICVNLYKFYCLRVEFSLLVSCITPVCFCIIMTLGLLSQSEASLEISAVKKVSSWNGISFSWFVGGESWKTMRLAPLNEAHSNTPTTIVRVSKNVWNLLHDFICHMKILRDSVAILRTIILSSWIFLPIVMAINTTISQECLFKLPPSTILTSRILGHRWVILETM